ncbi:hypothetical protein DFQ26_003911, partial [Actinomortierella ambigua]
PYGLLVLNGPIMCMYSQLFIKTSAATVGIVLEQAIDSLNAQDQLELNDYLRLYLIGRVLLDENSRQILHEP